MVLNDRLHCSQRCHDTPVAAAMSWRNHRCRLRWHVCLKRSPPWSQGFHLTPTSCTCIACCRNSLEVFHALPQCPHTCTALAGRCLALGAISTHGRKQGQTRSRIATTGSRDPKKRIPPQNMLITMSATTTTTKTTTTTMTMATTTNNNSSNKRRSQT